MAYNDQVDPTDNAPETQAQPAPAAPNPWSDAEGAAAQQAFQVYLSSHPGYGDYNDGLRAYQTLRQQGQGHDAALQGAFSTLGWNTQAPTAHVDPDPPPPTYQPPTATPTAPAPTFTPPGYTPPPAFNYADFVAPDPNKLNDDPLFKFTMQREQDAISKRAAAAGGLFTGGTYDALMRNAADVSGAGYQQMYDRDKQSYMMNRGNALDSYNTNYGTQFKDPYQIKYQGSQDAFNSQIHNFDTGRSYDWARTMFDADQGDKAFDRKYRIYSGL
jgi:hypothetical protein